MAKHQGLNLVTHRERLISAGLPFRKVQRHVRELRDHLNELQHEAAQRGLSESDARSWALQQLGDLHEIGTGMLQHSNRRSAWFRYPKLMSVLFPLGLYFLVLAGVVLTMFGIAMGSEAIYGEFNAVTAGTFVQQLFNTLRLFLLYGLPSLISLILIRQHFRQAVPEAFVIGGIVLLTLLGATTQMYLSWPDPVAQSRGSIGVSVLAEWRGGNLAASILANWRDSYTWRVLVNVVLCGAAWLWWKQRIAQENVDQGAT